jgi:hypothetical protein
MKTFKQFYDEEVAVNSTGAGVDMNPTGGKKIFNKVDRRSRWDVEKLYKRAKGKK